MSEGSRRFRAAVIEDNDDFTVYGLPNQTFDLGNVWRSFEVEFEAAEIGAGVSDGRFRVLFPRPGVYWIDEPLLERVDSGQAITQNRDMDALQPWWTYFEGVGQTSLREIDPASAPEGQYQIGLQVVDEDGIPSEHDWYEFEYLSCP
jgi:hypothetical protein